MKYFTPDYLEFFKELAANNNKEWFDINRKRYELVVREPFKKFVADLIMEVSKDDPEVQIEAKDAIFRINRDIRFSKDKTPYKLNNSAIISKEGRKDKNYPGIYIEFGPEKLRFYGGVFMPDSRQIQKIRASIMTDLNLFKSLINEKEFHEKFDKIHGEKNKRIPKEFRESAKNQPLLFNKQWYYFAGLSPKIILQNNLMNILMDYYKVSKNMQLFLKDVLY